MALRFIKNLKSSSTYSSEKFILFADFETTVYKNQHYVTCFVLNSPKFEEVYSDIIKFDKNLDIKIASNNILISFLKKIIELVESNKTKETIIYFHNLGKFDGLFLIRSFSNFNNLKFKVITRDNIFYEIRVTLDNIQFKFRDSFLLFPLSLDKIATLFNEKKIIFTEFDAPYEHYSNESFQKSLLEYCKQDVKILQNALLWYHDYIKTNYNLSIYSCLTLPSLAFKIYRTHFYKNSFIYQSHGFMDSFIRKSYRGGVVDVYKPYLENGYYYDVNSLYPYIMSISDMPVGPGVYKKLEINDSFSIDNFFGFVSVKVKTPKSLYIPFLTTNHKIYGLISPLGEWTDTYFSEEIKYALTLGYEFEYYAYYKFDKKNIFSDYVITLYNERLKNKDKPELNGILKLLLNSLYGRFGMANSVYKNIFLKNTRKDKELLRKINLLYDAEIISTFKNLRKKDINTLTLLRYNEMPNFDNIFNLYKRGLLSEKDYKNILNEAKNKANDLNVSVHIASAITAYARIYMHKIKSKYQDSLYYSDTDSLIVDKEIDRELVSLDKIGLFKLENQVKRGIFISPKLYYLELENSVVKKSKGLDAALLSYKDFLCLYQEKPIQVKVSNNFIRDLKTYTINTSEQEIEVTGYLVKREKIFDQNGKWIETKPLFINN